MDYCRVVRHRTLSPEFAGSNPVSPIKSVFQDTVFLYPFLGILMKGMINNELCD